MARLSDKKAVKKATLTRKKKKLMEFDSCHDIAVLSCEPQHWAFITLYIIWCIIIATIVSVSSFGVHASLSKRRGEIRFHHSLNALVWSLQALTDTHECEKTLNWCVRHVLLFSIACGGATTRIKFHQYFLFSCDSGFFNCFFIR